VAGRHDPLEACGVTEPGDRVYAFGPFLLDSRERRLLRDGQPVPLTIKAFDVLEALARNEGRLVRKKELLRLVWPDAAVEENNLTVTVSALRKALGEGPADRQYIETVPRRGYRFVGALREPTPAPASPARKAKRRWLAGAAALAGLCLATAGLWWTSQARNVPAPVRSLAVLPFHSLTDTESEYIGLGMADALITRLASTKRMVVRSTGAVQKYARSDLDPVAAGRELRVDAVLDGSIQSAEGRLRATVRLLRVSDGSTLWAQAFDERASGIFSLQDSISQKLAEELTLRLTDDQRKVLMRRDTDDSEAYQLYLKGRFFWNKRTREGFQRGLAFFREAVDRDPTYARAYTGVADSYIGLAYYQYERPHEAMRQAKAEALKALKVAPSLAEAHVSLAHVYGNYDWDWTAAEREWRQAILLDPEYGTAHQWYAVHYLAPTGRLEEAIAEARRARELDPLSPVFNAFVGATLLFARRYDEAIDECRKTIDLHPDFGVGHWYLGRAYLQKRLYPAALAELRDAVRLSGESPLTQGTLAFAYAASGERAAARGMLSEMARQRSTQYVSALDLAVTAAALGEREQAFGWLEEAAAERAFHLVYLKVWPELDALRPDPRFAAIVRRVGLAP
jgi:DNA-binding winged helix-turn-helix (wHTH) protein/TolB-like protein/Tfp pilus assembly protein PilF